MQPLDNEVVESAARWSQAGEDVWLCTVLATYGSSPREPGALLAARRDGHCVGSLSGGCVEEDFLARLQAGDFQSPVQVVRYGESEDDRQRLALPCGGILEVLVERLPATRESLRLLTALREALHGQRRLVREVSLATGATGLETDEASPTERQRPRIQRKGDRVCIRMGPTRRLVIAGVSPVSVACAEFARSLGFEVVVCDPRDELIATFNVADVELRPELPSSYLAREGCHASTAVVALTHDPRIDDLAMIEALRTPAFYIGVMGSRKTSATRAERLRRSGGLDREQVERIRMPIGLDIGSKTPAEIALAVMADVVGVYHGRERL
ncbi:xanthine dehydrogenase accessory factor [Modicisalibacter muralis]|uniref:Xanthine dehydrogenase accessory factor n=1 Tax=Modicisalibacter muralis TaxID=119000 RepID=A0A1G9HWK0_9GAMM|nr:XdhC family protein [Halomonas muralis]SDL17205.1 xanthine dehydrogenase accessory factor [Halomonas muralis]